MFAGPKNLICKVEFRAKTVSDGKIAPFKPPGGDEFRAVMPPRYEVRLALVDLDDKLFKVALVELPPLSDNPIGGDCATLRCLFGYRRQLADPTLVGFFQACSVGTGTPHLRYRSRAIETRACRYAGVCHQYRHEPRPHVQFRHSLPGVREMFGDFDGLCINTE